MDYKSNEDLLELTFKAETVLSDQDITSDPLPSSSSLMSGDEGFIKGLTMVNMPKRSYFIHSGLGMSNFSNKSIEEQGWDRKGGFGYMIEFGYYQKIRPLIAIGIGIGLSSFANQISIEKINDTITGLIDPPDIEPQDNFAERIEYLNPTEDTRISFLDIPVFIEFGNTNVDKLGFFLRLGVKLSTPLIDQFSGKGFYSIKGYYPKYGVELESIEELGFVNNALMYTGAPTYELNSLNISGMLSGGISLVFNTNWIFKAGVNYVHGFTDLSKNIEPENYRQNNRNHLLENNQSATYIRSLGFEIGLQYVLDFY
jgi:hypothetical protein